jgi:hypothetical protein
MSSADEGRSHFVRPPAHILEEIAATALANGGEPFAGDGVWVESGSSTVVLLLGETAVRVGRQPWDSAAMLRSQALVDNLPELPFDVPRSVGMPAASGGYLAIPTRRLRGEPHPSGRGDPTVLRGLLEAIHGVSPDAIRPYLAQARAFTGGSDWEDVLRN